MKLKVSMTVLLLALCGGLLGGCKKTENTETVPEETSEGARDYSKGLTEEGYLEGVTATDYLDFDAKEIVISKKEVDGEVNSSSKEIWDYIAAQYPTEDRESVIKSGDKVNIDYSGSVDGVKFDGGTAEGATVTAGSQEFIDDFLTQIIGHKAGDTFDVNVTFPDPYQNNPDLAGKPAVFEVTINYIAVPAVIDDEFVVKNGEMIYALLKEDEVLDFKTKKEFDDFLYRKNYPSFLQKAITSKLGELELIKEAPDSVTEYARSFVDYSYYSGSGMHVDDLLKAGYLTEDQVEESVRGQVILELACQVVGEKQKIVIGEDAFPEVTGQEDNTELIATYGKGYIARIGMQNKAMDWLVENVTVSEE